ncbi:hypothetical protein [Mycolicibacterium thermoresistibile]|uniref:hypothetical protein n=1 Tax=Mycolicibacterium thermoresistibile TaxID=1797 RepID=UPI0007738092|nr:hypothetical protein [Mycolicibacterium thermoresistibile]MCV7187053.1 hypothetical protein [Mycolicibacterium thermoresistibile]
MRIAVTTLPVAPQQPISWPSTGYLLTAFVNDADPGYVDFHIFDPEDGSPELQMNVYMIEVDEPFPPGMEADFAAGNVQMGGFLRFPDKVMWAAFQRAVA